MGGGGGGGRLREASGLEYFRRQFIREEDIIVLTGVEVIDVI